MQQKRPKVLGRFYSRHSPTGAKIRGSCPMGNHAQNLQMQLALANGHLNDLTLLFFIFEHMQLQNAVFIVGFHGVVLHLGG